MAWPGKSRVAPPPADRLFEPLEPRVMLTAVSADPDGCPAAAVAAARTADSVIQTVEGQFGKDSPAGEPSFTTTDNRGTQVTFVLKGPGVGSVTSNEEVSSFALAFTGTTPQSRVSVKVRDGNEAREIFLSGVTVDGSLRSFVARDVNLDGDFTVSAVLLKLEVDDFNEVSLDQHTLDIRGAGASPGDAVGLKFDALFDATIVSALPIKRFVADQWIDFDDGAVPDSLTAPSMGSFVIRGDPGDDEPGDMEANVTLTDADAVLRKFRVKNDVLRATIRSAGDVKSFVAGGLLESTLFVGVDAAAPAGVFPEGEALGNKTLGSFKVSSPIFNLFGTPSLRDSVVAAGSIGRIVVADVAPGAAEQPFGFVTRAVRSYRSDAARLKAAQLQTPGDYDVVGDYTLRVLPAVIA